MDKQEFVLAVIDKVDEKRKEVNTLTCEILELENDLNQKNISKIKQNITKIINAIESFSSPSAIHFLRYLEFMAKNIFTDLSDNINDKHSVISQTRWNKIRISWLERFCIDANAWNPIEFDLSKKSLKIEFKNLNLSIININR